MCGIAGILRSASREATADCVSRMILALAHRGPDASGVWISPGAEVGLGHRRLSILDLSDAGAQPMHSECGRLSVTFNGEIYNHLDIRAELEAAGAAPNWRGHSDTETLLAAVLYWGAEKALQRFVGMYVFGLWDAKERTLTLGRDRFGEKPLYYGWCGRDLMFGSELKALATHRAWAPTLDRKALTAFMRYSYVPAPSTIWVDIKKLPPASYVTFAADVSPGSMPAPRPYWSLLDVVIAAQTERFSDEREAVVELQRLLSIAIKRQCFSDVPLGAFLSGGIDSSTIVALMQVQSSFPVRTFTIGFSESAYDEARMRARWQDILAPRTPNYTSIPVRRWMSSRSCRRCTTSHSPTLRRFRLIWYPSSRDSMSPWRSPVTPAMSCLAATTDMCGVVN